MFILQPRTDGDFDLRPQTFQDSIELDVDDPRVRKERGRVWVQGVPKVCRIYRMWWGSTYGHPTDLLGGDYGGQEFEAGPYM